MKYINQWMKDGKTKFVISQEELEWRIVNEGLPHGGILSPILYAIYTNTSKSKNIDVRYIQII